MNCEISLFLKQMDWSGRVLNIISNDTENFLWNKMYDVYKFKPGTDRQCEWLQIIVVMGEKLIEMIEKEKVSLGI